MACALFAAAAITDYFDGKLARNWGQTCELGRMLDPIANKLLVAACLMVLVAAHTMRAAGLFAAVVIMLREILISGLREYLASVRVGLPVTVLAKWKTGFQMGAIGLLLLGPAGAATIGLSWFPNLIIGEGMLWMAATLTLVTGGITSELGYITQHPLQRRPFSRQRDPPRSPGPRPPVLDVRIIKLIAMADPQ